MVKLTQIYTRGGDGGESSLVGGARLAKHAARFEAIGAVDETNAAIGFAIPAASPETRTLLARIQHDLFDLGADLATPRSAVADGALRVTAAATQRLEGALDDLAPRLRDLESFILPGGGEAAARLHLARTLTRRAERRVSALLAEDPGETSPECLKYLNRLSDLLFQLARAENADGADDVLWRPGRGAD